MPRGLRPSLWIGRPDAVLLCHDRHCLWDSHTRVSGNRAAHQELEFARDGPALFIKLCAAVIASALISVLSLFINPLASASRFGLCAAGLFGIVASSYVVTSLLPSTAVFCYADYIHTIALTLVVVVVMESALSLHLHLDGGGSNAWAPRSRCGRVAEREHTLAPRAPSNLSHAGPNRQAGRAISPTHRSRRPQSEPTADHFSAPLETVDGNLEKSWQEAAPMARHSTWKRLHKHTSAAPEVGTMKRRGSALAPLFATKPGIPPPLPSSCVDNRAAWAATVVPLVGSVFGFVIGLPYGLIYWILNVVVCAIDGYRLKAAGHKAPETWTAVLVPVYLWQRGTRLRSGHAMFWVWVVSLVLSFGTDLAAHELNVEAAAVPIVTSIIREQLGGTVDCVSVTITETPRDGFHIAEATLQNGTSLAITIEEKSNGEIYVLIPNQ